MQSMSTAIENFTVEKKRRSCFAEKWILKGKALLLDFEKHRGLFL